MIKEKNKTFEMYIGRFVKTLSMYMRIIVKECMYFFSAECTVYSTSPVYG